MQTEIGFSTDYSFNTVRSRRLDKLSRKHDKNLTNCKPNSKRYAKFLDLKQNRAAKAARIRKERLELYTTWLASNYNYIKIDDFTFEGSKDVIRKKQRNELYRCMKYEFKQRLEQKAAETGCKVSYVNHQTGQRTTKKCSCCDSYHIKIVDKRRIICLDCGFEEDRDVNAAINAFKLIP